MDKPAIMFAPFSGPGQMCHRHGWGDGLAVRIEGTRNADGYYCGACFAELIAAHCPKVGYLEAPEADKQSAPTALADE